MTNTINELDGLRITPTGRVDRYLRASELRAGDPILLDDGLFDGNDVFVAADIITAEPQDSRVRIVARPRRIGAPVREIAPLSTDLVRMPSAIAQTVRNVIALTRHARASRARRAGATR
jgi:hypothetical protein